MVSWDLMGFYGNYRLLTTNSLLLNMAKEIVDFPIKTCDFSIVMLNYQRVMNCAEFPVWSFGGDNAKNLIC